MIIGYARTSLASENIENQLSVLMQKGVSQENIFMDVGVSGSISPFTRPGFQRLFDTVKNSQVDYLYVYELSRLSRDLTDTLNILRDLDRLGVCVESLSPNESWLNCDPSIKQLIVSVLGWCAQRERENLIERTKVGMLRARAEGKHIGRPYKKIDWKYVYFLHSEGMNFKEISEKIDIPYSTLMRRKGEHPN